MTATFRFDRFSLDTGDRKLRNGGEAVELNSRYFDALVLLVSEQGRLVAKDRFMDEVWRGIPVTDEALTQCIRTLRRQLGDDAANPRFIETVPKHGYRFIAKVERSGVGLRRRLPSKLSRELLFLGGAGTVGGGIAGILGGLFYGFATASAASSGEISVLIVMLIVAVVLGLVGAAAVAFGIVAAATITNLRSGWTIAGGAAGGLLIGAVVKLIGLDAFVILFGRSPGDITGAGEGLVLGAVIGFAVWLGGGRSLRRSVGAALVFGAPAGVLIAIIGGHLMGGSLADLSNHFPGSRLRLDAIARLFGETSFGPITQAATAALEAAIFAACVAGAMAVARKESEQG